MRGKKAKELRREIRKLPQVATAYEAKQPIPVGWGIKVVPDEGNPSNWYIKPGSGVFDQKLMTEGENYVPVAFKSGQIRMVQNTTRKVYQVVKEQVKKFDRLSPEEKRKLQRASAG